MINKERDFIARDVFRRQHLKNLQTTGYEAYRISPRKTIKYGKEYKRIYGASVEPDYTRVTGKNRYGAIVKWYPHGYTSPKMKSGTRLLGTLRYYPVDQKEARFKLMLKKRKTRKKLIGVGNWI